MTKDHNDPFYTIDYEEEAVIYKVGDESPCMYAILQGRVSLYKQTSSGEIQIKSIGPGNYLGAVSYLGEIPRRYKAVATQFTRLQQLYEDNLEAYIQHNSQSVVVLMDDLSQRLSAADKSLGQIGGVNKCEEGDEAACDIEDVAMPEAQKSAPKRKAPEVNDLKHPVYPKGHKHYDLGLTPDHEEILFDKNVKCPVCEFDFTLYQMRTSHLKLVKTKPDMRKIHEGVDEIWYNIWTCPHCKYSSFHYDYLKLKSTDKEKLREEMAGKLADFKLPETLKTSYNEVFDSYYLAMTCKTILGASAYVMGRLWLHLAWMYDDCDDQEMFDIAYEHAREYYAKGWFSERVQLTPDSEQKLAILIAEMHIHAGMLDDARKFIFEAVNIKDGTKFLSELARDRMMDIKEQIRLKKEAEASSETEEK